MSSEEDVPETTLISSVGHVSMTTRQKLVVKGLLGNSGQIDR